MARRPSYEGMYKGGLSFSMASQSVSTSRPWQGAKTHHTHLNTSVQDVGHQGMVPSTVLRHRKTNPLIPYKPDAWCRQLERHGLLGRYPDLYLSLTQGFDVGVPSIQQIYIPPNSSLINKYPEVYKEIVETEFQKGRYLGPFSRVELESLIRPFQSSPLSLVTKPRKPGKYHMVLISHTCTHHAQIQFNLSILPSVHRIFPAPGEISPQYVSSSISCHQGSRVPSEMCLKLIRPSLSITANGQAWWCNLRVKTTSQQTQTTVLALPQQAGPMASLLMQEQISST